MWKCPAGCKIDKGVVCGGDYPYYIRSKDQYETGAEPEGYSDYPNMYILVDLESNKLLKKVYGGSAGLDLDYRDWEELFEHAEAGCISEPQCPKCLEFLVEEKE